MSLHSIVVCYVQVTFYIANLIYFFVKFEHHRFVCNLFPFCNKSGEEPGGVAKKKTKVKGTLKFSCVELSADNV